MLKYAAVNPAAFIEPETDPLFNPPRSMATAQATGAVTSMNAIPIPKAIMAIVLSATNDAPIMHNPDTNKPIIGTILLPHFLPYFNTALSLSHPPLKQPNPANK